MVPPAPAPAQTTISVQSDDDAPPNVPMARIAGLDTGTGRAYHCVFSPSGNFIAFAHEEAFAYLVPTQPAENPEHAIKRLEGGHAPNHGCLWVCFSPDERFLVSVGGRTNVADAPAGEVCVWSVPDGALIRKLDGHTNTVRFAAFLHGSPTLLITGAQAERTARVWNVETGECLRVLVTQDADLFSVGSTRDGRFILTGDVTGRVRVWDAAVPSVDPVRVLTANPPLVDCVGIHPDPENPEAFYACVRNVLTRWNATTGEQISRVEAHGYQGSSSFSEITELNAAGTRGVLVVESSHAAVFDVATGARVGPVVYNYDAQPIWAAFHPTLQFLALCGEAGDTLLYSIPLPEQQAQAQQQ